MRIWMAIILLLTSTVWADTAPRTRIVVLPLKLRWEQQSISPRQFFEVLEEEVEHLAPRANLVVPQEDDPRLLGLDLSRRPTLEQCKSLSQEFNAPFIVSLDITFQRKIEKRSAGDLVQVGGLALVQIFDSASGKLVVEQPVGVGHCDHLASSTLEEISAALGAETARDLARLIIVEAQRYKAGLKS